MSTKQTTNKSGRRSAKRDPETTAAEGYQVPDDRLLTLSEAARQLNRHPTTIRNWISIGAIDAVKQPNGLFRIFQSTVDFWRMPEDPAKRARSLLQLAMVNAKKADNEDLLNKIKAIL